MTAVRVPLSDEHSERLRELAAAAGIDPGEYLRRRVEELLAAAPAPPAFGDAAAHVLRKNAELYRRLA